MTRIAIVIKERCNPIGCGNYLCARMCPVNREGNECIAKSPNHKAAISEKLCTGCGICPNICPFDAIRIINLPEELTKQPIHRYGENEFVLYSIPAPLFGSVTGVIGVNGIGKSTAIKILAGVLKPNFGKFNEKMENEEIYFSRLISYFKGTEAQGFFEKVKSGAVKTAYKPQQVELIPRTAKGRVIDLLSKVDERKMLDSVAGSLQIRNILDNEIAEISGGELQRVAIAATILKSANIYIFDEPTSYLDIRQRINASRLIKSLSGRKSSVLLIEHDLVILDHMTDFTHIMYGREACYGIVSAVKPTRNGINSYLQGYLKEENIRFRESQIKFTERPPVKKALKDAIVSWEGIGKMLGKFSLKSNSGSINKGDIIGVLGENGIGKTTFVKILANVIKADGGKIEGKVKVSYKPQYLESSDRTVGELLKTAFEKYENQIISPLFIKSLVLKRLDELSGGELQRVAIADCLQKEADLYLLDEPSAYLDSEQRLAASKAIRDFIDHKGASALIVDHDLLFIDYISQRLIIFTGTPAISGNVEGPFDMEEGMNKFLKELGITLRRDKESNRPRINKLDSRLDREQKEDGKYYYA